jgi:hypothetical protein
MRAHTNKMIVKMGGKGEGGGGGKKEGKKEEWELQEERERESKILKEMKGRRWNVKALCQEKHCDVLNCKKRSANYKIGQEVNSIATFREYVSTHYNKRSGNFVDQLIHFSKYFPRSQIMVLNFDSLPQNSSNVIQSLESFMGLKHHLKDMEMPHQNTADAKDEFKTVLDCHTRDMLHRYYTPSVERLMEFMNGDLGKSQFEPNFPSFENGTACVDV